MVQDPVCKMELDPADSAAEIVFEDVTHYFCSPSCAEDFKAKPETYVKKS